MPILNERTQQLMALLKLRRAAQITLPAALRRQFNLSEGDYLEAEAVKDGILLKPVSVVERQKGWQRVLDVMDRVQAKQPKSKKSPQEQEEEIADIIQSHHTHHA
jgi:AbrB family looped-hinge helix DNA binding protein